MSTEIIKVLDDLSKRFGVAIDWTDKNVMPYLQDLYVRYIRYRMCGAVLWLVIGIILLVISIKCFVWLKNITTMMNVTTQQAKWMALLSFAVLQHYVLVYL